MFPFMIAILTIMQQAYKGGQIISVQVYLPPTESHKKWQRGVEIKVWYSKYYGTKKQVKRCTIPNNT